jgi:hypothetical protein
MRDGIWEIMEMEIDEEKWKKKERSNKRLLLLLIGDEYRGWYAAPKVRSVYR